MYEEAEKKRLNPCCAGRCYRRTFSGHRNYPGQKVLILVVLEDAIGALHRRRRSGRQNVLILVVLEDAIGEEHMELLNIHNES